MILIQNQDGIKSSQSKYWDFYEFFKTLAVEKRSKHRQRNCYCFSVT